MTAEGDIPCDIADDEAIGDGDGVGLASGRFRFPVRSDLSVDAYRTRLKVVVRGLWAFAVIVALVGVLNEDVAWHVVVDMIPVVVALAVAQWATDRRVTTAAVTLGLSLAAATLVHFTDGLIESHFAFFVALPLIALLHDWRAVVGAALTVFTHHAVAGTVRPANVYNHPAALANPILWGLIHVVFVLALVVVLFVHWRYSEIAHQETRRALGDLTDSQDEVLAAGERFRQLAQNAFDVIIVVDDQLEVTFLGGAFEEVFRREPGEYLHRSVFDLRALIHPDDDIPLTQAIDRLARGEGAQFVQGRLIQPDGGWRWIELVARKFETSLAKNGLVINVRDIHDRASAELAIRHQALHDDLTGLANRKLLVERIDHALTSANHTEADGRVGLAFFDLDRFKDINDTLGHAMGDRLLVGVANRLAATLGDSGTVARLGGDEFVMLVNEVSSITDLEELAHDASREIERSFVFDDIELRVATSVGVAVAEPGDDADILLRNADVAMYQAKHAGRGRVEQYDDAVRARTRERMAIESTLREADYDRSLLVHYQPLTKLSSGAITGVEALARWHHPERGVLSPAQFIPVAEETRLIIQIGERVLTEACIQATEWADRYGLDLDVSVNVSAVQLTTPGFSETVRSVIEATGIQPSKLMLEVTESALIMTPEVAVRNLRAVRELGVKVALDDFGTGYAGLTYLRTLPVTHIKIDRSFTAGLGTDDRHAGTIVENTISLAHDLGLVVIGEGVETATQYELLEDMGCDYGQGYYLARPAPAVELEATLLASAAELRRPAALASIASGLR